MALALALAARLEDHGRLASALDAYRRARTARPANRQAAFGEVRILVVDDEVNANAAWYYPAPKRAAEQITGYVAFYRDRVNMVED